MAYKDKDKQSQKQRDWVRQKRATKGSTGQGSTATSIANEVTAYLNIPNYGLPDCQCRHCQNNRRSGNKYTLNHGPYKKLAQLGTREYNRVSLPGDPDYTPEHSVGVPK